MTLTAARLRELFDYDRSTGLFRRKSARGCAPEGSVAGSPQKSGYLQIQIDGRIYLAHRLAWLYETGEFPIHEIDHVDGVRDNNRLANLREATRAQNNANVKVRKDSQSGLKGIYRTKTGWRAYLGKNGQRIHLGIFQTQDEAALAYDVAASLYHGIFSVRDSRGSHPASNEVAEVLADIQAVRTALGLPPSQEEAR